MTRPPNLVIARRALLGLIALAAAPVAAPVAAQGILVAPTAVFVDARSRTATLMLVNPNEERVEVELATAYGYPVTDSAGGLQLHMEEQPDSTAPNAAAWVRLFPRRMTLDPDAQQTVRILVNPPPGVADGEYRARLIITTRGATLPVTQQTDSGAVRVGFSIEVRTIIPLLYRKGKLTSGATLANLRAERRGDSLVVRTRLEPQGNAAVLGTVRAELVDSTGRTRARMAMPISAYVPIEPRFIVPLDSVPPGRYRLRLELASGRSDLPPETTLPFRTARDSVAVILP